MYAESNFDPILDHYRYTDELAIQQIKDMWIEREMHDLRADFLDRVATYVHPEYIEAFAGLITKGFHEEIVEAEKIAHKLNLTQRHFAAFEWDYETMKEIELGSREFRLDL